VRAAEVDGMDEDRDVLGGLVIPQLPHDAAVIALRKRGEDAIKASGKLLGGLAVPNLSIADMAARGYDFVTAASDITLLRDAALAQLAEMRGT
ncbi:MAG: hypothetical protein ABFS30_05575, partial [Pseudomonadota bacterium]